jgi:hypothetical protein
MTIAGGAKNPKLVCGRGKECGYSQPYEEGALEAAANGENAVAAEAPDEAADAPKRGSRKPPATVSP